MKFMIRGNIMQNLIFSIFPNQNFVDLGLFQFGWERCTPAHSFGPAARNHYLFHYILSGTGTLMADDSKGVTQTYSIKSMQGFMIFPNQITTYVADKQLPWEYVWLEFDGLRVKSLLDTMEAGKSVVITEGVKTNVVLSARNLPGVKTTPANILSVYDLLNAKSLVVDKAALAVIEEVYA